MFRLVCGALVRQSTAIKSRAAVTAASFSTSRLTAQQGQQQQQLRPFSSSSASSSSSSSSSTASPSSDGELWTVLDTIAVSRGCKNSKGLIDALKQVNTSFSLEDKASWGPVDAALRDSTMSCEMKLGLAHDLLGFEAQMPTSRPACAAVFLHIIDNCADHEEVFVSANYSLGVLSLEGVNMARDGQMALKCFGDAAKMGHALSIYQLAGMFLSGRDVKQDTAKVAKLLKLAVDRGLPQASTTLAELYNTGVGVPQDHELAAHYYEDAIQKGDVQAKAGLAVLYNNGKGKEQDFDKAFQLNTEAAEQGNVPLAHHNLGTHYFLGKGAEQSFDKARESFERAANLGFAPACFNLGNLYLQGRGCDQDLDLARKYYELAAHEIPDAASIIEKIDNMKAGKGADSTPDSGSS